MAEAASPVPGPRRALTLASFAAVVAAFLGEVIVGRRLYWKSDLSDYMFPLFQVLAESLRRRDISSLLWNPHILTGHPLLAEGQMGAFYPPNWILLALLSPRAAVSGSLVLGYSFTLAATAWFGRLLGMSRSAALASGAVFAFGGFAASHMIHANIVAGVPWLPVVLGLTLMGFRRRQRGYWVLAGFAWGLQWLAGHPQVPVMTALLAAAMVGARGLTLQADWKTRSGAVVQPLGLIVASGLALAAVYLLPLIEQGRVSVRPGGLMPYGEATFASLEPRALVTAILPFFYGGPEDYRGPPSFYEFGFYAGCVTLILAAGALACRSRRRWALFFGAVAGVSLLLALGRYTPAYRLAHMLPGLRSLRVPARFVFLLDFSLAVSAGLGLDALSRSSDRTRGVRRGLAVGALVTAAAVMALAGAKGWLSAGALSLGAAWLCTSPRLRPRAWRAAGLLLLLADLWIFWTQAHAFHRVAPDQAVVVDPALAFVAEQRSAQQRVARIVRGDLLNSDRSILYGLRELGGFASIPIDRVDRYVSRAEHDASARFALHSLAAVRYLVVDEAMPRPSHMTHEGVDYRPNWPLALLGRDAPESVSYVLAGAPADEVRLVCSFDGRQALAQGSELVRLTVQAQDGIVLVFPLRKGIDLVEPDAGGAASGAPIVAHRDVAEGRPFLLYYVRLPLGQRLRVARLSFDLLERRARFGLYGLNLVLGEGGAVPLSPLAQQGYRLVHRTERSLIFENDGALDRAYAVHKVRLATDDADALDIVSAGGRRPSAVVLEDPDAPRPSGRGPSQVTIAADAPTRVELLASMGGDGYVVLSDAHHPAWKAFVDGVPAPIHHANSAFRAVYVPDGEHRVVFRFEPFWLRVGAGVSLATLVAGAAALAWIGSRRRRVAVP